MRYILDSLGYIEEVSFGAIIECKNNTCTEYTGEVPDGYETLGEWAIKEDGKLNAWKISEGNLVFDNARYSELQKEWEKQEKNYRLVKGYELDEIKEAMDIIIENTEKQYKKSIVSGEVVSINNSRETIAKIKLTDIDFYSYEDFDLVITNKNMLPNTASTQTISGVTFTQNEDRSITLDGTSTNEIEYNIYGTSTSTSSLLCLKKGFTYYLSSNGYQIKMYYYDGTDRTEVYSGTGGIINFNDDNKIITQICLCIPNNTTYDNELVSPQLEYGTEASSYEMHKSNSLSMNFGQFKEDGLFPRDDLFPSDDLFPFGITIDYIKIEEGTVTISVNSEENHLGEGTPKLYNGKNIIYTFQDMNVAVEYNTIVLEVDSLEFLQGKSTTSDKFAIKEDGTIIAKNGYFNGNIELVDDGGEWSSLTINNGDGSYVNDSKNFMRSNGINVVSKYDPETYMFFYLNRGYPIMQMNYSDTYIGIDTTYVTAETGDTHASNSWYNILNCISPSKEELKEEINKFSNGLNLISASDIYEYKLKEEKTNKKRIGLIIGDNYNTPKEVVSLNNDGIDLYSMVSVSWNAIKELNAKIEKLENRIKELEEKE